MVSGSRLAASPAVAEQTEGANAEKSEAGGFRHRHRRQSEYELGGRCARIIPGNVVVYSKTLRGPRVQFVWIVVLVGEDSPGQFRNRKTVIDYVHTIWSIRHGESREGREWFKVSEALKSVLGRMEMSWLRMQNRIIPRIGGWYDCFIVADGHIED